MLQCVLKVVVDAQQTGGFFECFDGGRQARGKESVARIGLVPRKSGSDVFRLNQEFLTDGYGDADFDGRLFVLRETLSIQIRMEAK